MVVGIWRPLTPVKRTFEVCERELAVFTLLSLLAALWRMADILESLMRFCKAWAELLRLERSDFEVSSV